MREFTEEELSKCDGQNNGSAFVAYKGLVYDVSESFLWRGGEHQVLHRAGKDLTDDLKDAPHGPDMLEKFPVVGTLQKDE